MLKIVLRVCFLALVALAVTACGQRGPLYLPKTTGLNPVAVAIYAQSICPICPICLSTATCAPLTCAYSTTISTTIHT